MYSSWLTYLSNYKHLATQSWVFNDFRANLQKIWNFSGPARMTRSNIWGVIRKKSALAYFPLSSCHEISIKWIFWRILQFLCAFFFFPKNSKFSGLKAYVFWIKKGSSKFLAKKSEMAYSLHLKKNIFFKKFKI